MKLLCKFTLVLSAIPAVHAVQRPKVTLASGVVVGTTTSIPSATATVNQFLGVPFAAPPDRFCPPTEPKSWHKPLDASKKSPACLQQINCEWVPLTVKQPLTSNLKDPEAKRVFTNLFFNNPPPKESEDCLYLNIYAPSTEPPPGGFAVMFWIYGGSLALGNAGQPMYDGSQFAAFEDVILIAANYRTNVFGFPSSPEIQIDQRNLGFLDQRFALQWVQKNIAAFGGDPKKVTVFGESAGATSTDTLITSWPDNPPFRAAILESGQSSMPIVGDVGNNSTDSWVQLIEALDCTEAESQLSCVQAAKAEKIQSIIEHIPLTFRPVFDNVTLVSNGTAVRAANNIANVPIMVGSNGQEGRIFVYGQANVTGFLDRLPGMTPALQEAIINAYPIGAFGTSNESEVLAQIETDLAIGCVEGALANQSFAAGYPTWRYYYNATFPNQQLLPDMGAYHSAEIAEVFSTYAAFPTAQQVALSTYMRGAWARFAKDPLGGPGWSAIGSPNGLDLGILGTNGSTGVIIVNRETIDVNCHLFDPINIAAGKDIAAGGFL